MYNMLRHNKVYIPEDGLSVLRLFSLDDWHRKNLYSVFTNEEDDDVLPFVKDFDHLRRSARKAFFTSTEMTDEECNELWDSHYSHIARKYGASEKLLW